jgi:two-component system NarL family sensor kinase
MSILSRKIEQHLFNVSERTRWLIIIGMFLVVASLDFITPPEYILAYLYALPILVSVSFLKPAIAQTLLLLSVLATLLNLFFPEPVTHIPSVLVNRLLAALSVIISAFFMVQYIRHQKIAQEQEKLLATERTLAQMREDFTATLTHDLKTPLLGEQKALQHLQQGLLGTLSSEQYEVLEALTRGKHRQLELVNSLLSVYKHDNLGVQLRMEAVNLDDLIADILTEVQPLARERKIELEYTCQRTPPPVRGEAFQLKRVLANLLHNALNYTPSGGFVRVRLLEEMHGLILVEVADTGPGIPEADLEKIFHRFYQAEGTRDMVGTGLGLYLSRQLIHAHRGRIWAENSLGGGCKFSFTLPIEELGSDND